MVGSRSVSLRPSLLLFTLYEILSLMDILGDVPSVTCATVAFLKISVNVSNAFKYSITGSGKGDTGNGFLSASVSSMADFAARYFYDKYGNWHCCRKTPLCQLHALMTSW